MDEKKISVSKLSKTKLEELGVYQWPIWEKEVSTFDWHYDTKETCYILEGQVTVEPKDGIPVEFGAGDYVSFPEGMDCVWRVKAPVRKHYSFG
jgi:uncharacterized cupin superfamily protein